MTRVGDLGALRAFRRPSIGCYEWLVRRVGLVFCPALGCVARYDSLSAASGNHAEKDRMPLEANCLWREPDFTHQFLASAALLDDVLASIAGADSRIPCLEYRCSHSAATDHS